MTVLAGILLYIKLYMDGGTGAYALAIGGLLGIIMMVNVHAIYLAQSEEDHRGRDGGRTGNPRTG